MTFKNPWELADEMPRLLARCRPHRWTVVDSEYGRPTAFRVRLAKRYILEVPLNIVMRKVGRQSPMRNDATETS